MAKWLAMLGIGHGNLSKAIYISHNANTLEKGMDSTILPSSMSK